ncbi:MAG: hypothetical protein U5S82_21885 [Gammaproteobacteria bacterium]|nr:hypothetical protein [Gammaproteobacteria bacterium]
MKKQPLVLAMISAMSVTSNAWAGPHGFDLHNTIMPASQAMAGTSHARPQDLPSAIFGNPATLTQYDGGTRFTFGASFYMPQVVIDHDGTVNGGFPFREKSGTDVFPVPIVGVAQDLQGLGIPAVLGLGVTATSGVGATFVDDPKSLGAGAEFIVFGVNAGAGFPITENLSLGAMATISFAQIDAGLSSTSKETHDLGLRLTAGLTYDIGNTTIGLWGQTEQKHNFDNLFQTGVDGDGFPTFSNQKIEQPWNVGISIANSDLLNGDLLVAFDYIHKAYGDAAFWQDVWEDQDVFSLGLQWNPGKRNWVWRAGVGFAEDPNRSDASKLGDLTQVVAGPAGGGNPLLANVVPINTVTVPFLQATQTVIIYEWRAGLGFGYRNFLMPGLDVDVGLGWEFAESRTFGGHTEADTWSKHLGAALTWNFK